MIAIVRPLAVCSGLMLLGPSSAWAQARGGAADAPARLANQPPLTTSLRDLGILLARAPDLSPGIRSDRQRASATVVRLQALSRNWPAESPADYRANLASDVAALTAAVDSPSVPGLSATLEALADDLQIKLEHCTKSGGKLGGSVVVRVRSVRGGDEVKNWQVFYIPRVLAAAGSATPDRFPRLTSPSNESLVPGRYVMWLKDPVSDRLGERTTVKIGDGMKELLLDLPVPADTRQ